MSIYRDQPSTAVRGRRPPANKKERFEGSGSRTGEEIRSRQGREGTRRSGSGLGEDKGRRGVDTSWRIGRARRIRRSTQSART